ncbi:MAG: MraY family glycosyltransferase [Flavobacteriales bacterium]
MMNLSEALPAFISFLTSLVIAWTAMPFVIRFANKRQLFDIPDGRKLHDDNISRIGGIAIMFSVIVSISLFIDTEALPSYGFLIAGTVIIFFVGLLDDMYPIKPFQKLIGEFIPASLLVIAGKETLTHLNGLFGIHGLPEWLSIFLTFILVLAVVNSFNLIDGINGLAGICGLIISLSAGIMALYFHQINLAVIALSLAGGIVAFLRFNLIKPRIFMGDSGSLLIGYMSAFLILSLINVPTFTSDSADYQSFSTLLHNRMFLFVLSALIVPLTDLSRVFVIRLIKGKSPFTADRNHIHHILLELGCSHFSASIILGLFSLFNIGIFFLCLNTDINTHIIVLLFVSLLLATMPKALLLFRKQAESKEATF